MTWSFAVLEDGESVLVEVGDHALLVVDHGRVQQNFLHFGMEDEASGFRARSDLACLCSCGCGIRRRLSCRSLAEPAG